MIIICDKCSKKFNVKDSDIPPAGRMLQCGDCGNKWFFKAGENGDIGNFNLNDKITSEKEDFEIQKSINIKPKTTKEKIPPVTEQIIEEAEKTIEKKEKNKKIGINENQKIKKKPNLASNFIVIIITFISIIIIFDTFKNELSEFIPGIIPLLDNLYQSFYDIYLFFKDLIK